MPPPSQYRTHRRQILRDWLVTAGLLVLGALLSWLLMLVDSSGGFVSMIFVLMVALTARLTSGYVYGITASFISVICVNYIFTYPYWAFNFTIAGYPLTFLTMLSVSLLVSALTSQIKRQEQLRAETEREAMRANLLRAVSHDLRTPLTSIVGSASQAEEAGSIPVPCSKRRHLPKQMPSFLVPAACGHLRPSKIPEIPLLRWRSVTLLRFLLERAAPAGDNGYPVYHD